MAINMRKYFEKDFASLSVESPVNKIVYKITEYIKNSHDYNSAIQLIIENNLKLEEIVSRTSRLTLKDIIIISDQLISMKK